MNRERVDNYSEYLPYVEMDVATVVDDHVTYQTLTENTKGEIIIPNVDWNFEIIVCKNICSHYIETIKKSNDDDCYIYNNKNVSVIVNEWCSRKIRLLFDDGG